MAIDTIRIATHQDHNGEARLLNLLDATELQEAATLAQLVAVAGFESKFFVLSGYNTGTTGAVVPLFTTAPDKDNLIISKVLIIVSDSPGVPGSPPIYSIGTSNPHNQILSSGTLPATIETGEYHIHVIAGTELPLRPIVIPPSTEVNFKVELADTWSGNFRIEMYIFGYYINDLT